MVCAKGSLHPYHPVDLPLRHLKKVSLKSLLPNGLGLVQIKRPPSRSRANSPSRHHLTNTNKKCWKFLLSSLLVAGTKFAETSNSPFPRNQHGTEYARIRFEILVLHQTDVVRILDGLMRIGNGQSHRPNSIDCSRANGEYKIKKAHFRYMALRSLGIRVSESTSNKHVTSIQRLPGDTDYIYEIAG